MINDKLITSLLEQALYDMDCSNYALTELLPAEFRSMNIEFKDDLPAAAATDGYKTVYINKTKMYELAPTAKQMMFILLHEAAHKFERHVLRKITSIGKEPKPLHAHLWMLAEELHINEPLRAKLGREYVPDGGVFCSKLESYKIKYDRRNPDWSVEWIFGELIKQHEGEGQELPAGMCSGTQGGDCEEPHDDPGTIEAILNRDEITAISQTLADIREGRRGAGDGVSDALENRLSELRGTNNVPLDKLLQQNLRGSQAGYERVNWTRLNVKRMVSRGRQLCRAATNRQAAMCTPPIPTFTAPDVKTLIMVLDVSGSLWYSNVELQTALATVLSVLQQTCASVRFITFSSEVDDDFVIDAKKIKQADNLLSCLNVNLTSAGGGTCFNAPLAHIKKNGYRADAILFITDGGLWEHPSELVQLPRLIWMKPKNGPMYIPWGITYEYDYVR